MTELSEFRLVVGAGEEVVGYRGRGRGSGGPEVVYLHGFGSEQGGEKAEFFRRRALDLGLGFCSFDFRGHGRSGGSMRDLSLTRCLEDLRAVVGFVQREADGGVAFLGSSMGGLVGLWFAALHPRDVAGGVYIAPAVGMAEGLRTLLGERQMREWERDGVTWVSHELGTFELGWHLFEDLSGYPTERLLELHSRPALAFQGKRDDRVDWRRVEAFAAAAGPLTRLILFEDGDHRLLEYRGKMWEAMAPFWARLAMVDGRDDPGARNLPAGPT